MNKNTPNKRELPEVEGLAAVYDEFMLMSGTPGAPYICCAKLQRYAKQPPIAPASSPNAEYEKSRPRPVVSRRKI